MAHYAFLDDNNIVTEVIVGISESEKIDGKTPEVWYGEFRGQTCKRTTTDGSFRKNYAGIGYSYDASKDAFIEPKPFDSWTLNESTCKWEAPKVHPDDGNMYHWNETTKRWNKIS